MKPANKKYLSQYKDQLFTAWKQQYSYNYPKTILQKFEEIFFDETGRNLNTNFACSHCILFLLGQCGRLYFTAYPEEAPDYVAPVVEDKKTKK